MKTRDCTVCRYLSWDKYLGPGQAQGHRCKMGHKPRMYENPDPHIGIEIKRKCADYKEDACSNG